MKARRRWLLAAIALAVLLAGVLAVPFFIDEPPPDDADLLPVRVEVPWEENGYHAFDVEPDDVYVPDGGSEEEGDEGQAVPPGTSEMAEGEGWDPDLARDFLERNADVLRKLEECLDRPRLQLPLEEGEDGKPLRYSAEKRILWSVGGDGQDAGGSRTTDDGAAFEDGKEPTLRLRAFPP